MQKIHKKGNNSYKNFWIFLKFFRNGRSLSQLHFQVTAFFIWSIFFEILAKNMVFTLCSIFSNSRHVIQDIKNSNINFIANTLQNMYAKFQLNPCSSFRGEDFWKSLRTTDDGRQTTDDDGRQVMTKAHIAFGKVS